MSGSLFSKGILRGVFYRQFTQRALILKKTPYDYPALTGSEHWKRKFRSVFRARDTDGDGYLTKKDFELSADRFISYMNLNEKQAKDMLKTRMYMWDKAAGGTEHPDGFIISEDDFMSRLMANGNAKLRGIIVDIACCDFDSMDIDGDDFISPHEHMPYFYGIGIPVKYSADVFKVLDTNGNGKISKEEFVQGLVDYLLSEDENSPYSCFMGPLAS